MNISELSRREFTRNLVLSTAGLALAPAFGNIIVPKPKDKLGIALVGLGYYSTDLLAPALQLTKNCYLAGIVTGSPEKAEKWKQKHNIPDKNIYNYQNFDQIANNPDIDVVYVVLPPSMHAEYVIRAAKAGKQVWCEKPMATSVKECEAMIKACRDNKVSLAIGYRMHHEPNTQEIMRFAREKTFGNIRMVSVAAGYFDGRTTHWKQKKNLGGGVMYDMGVYALQGARYAVGEEPISVVAQHFTNRPEIYKDVDETTLFTLQFPSGAVANCSTSFGMNMNYLYVTYEKGFARLDPFSAYNGIQGSSSKGPLNFTIENEQAKQMDDDALAIMNKKTMLVPGEEGLRDIRIVEGIYESARTGKIIKL